MNKKRRLSTSRTKTLLRLWFLGYSLRKLTTEFKHLTFGITHESLRGAFLSVCPEYSKYRKNIFYSYCKPLNEETGEGFNS
jgi:hypothetical protein